MRNNSAKKDIGSQSKKKKGNDELPSFKKKDLGLNRDNRDKEREKSLEKAKQQQQLGIVLGLGLGDMALKGMKMNMKKKR